jgi:hypothetical protein
MIEAGGTIKQSQAAVINMSDSADHRPTTSRLAHGLAAACRCGDSGAPKAMPKRPDSPYLKARGEAERSARRPATPRW